MSAYFDCAIVGAGTHRINKGHPVHFDKTLFETYINETYQYGSHEGRIFRCPRLP